MCYCAWTNSESVDSKRTLSKRNEIDLQTCIDNFDIHKDKIIRTQDSRNMGAKYLNEIDLGSREECLRLCCETETCDVFVYEEKVSIVYVNKVKLKLFQREKKKLIQNFNDSLSSMAISFSKYENKSAVDSIASISILHRHFHRHISLTFQFFLTLHFSALS